MFTRSDALVLIGASTKNFDQKKFARRLTGRHILPAMMEVRDPVERAEAVRIMEHADRDAQLAEQFGLVDRIVWALAPAMTGFRRGRAHPRQRGGPFTPTSARRCGVAASTSTVTILWALEPADGWYYHEYGGSSCRPLNSAVRGRRDSGQIGDESEYVLLPDVPQLGDQG